MRWGFILFAQILILLFCLPPIRFNQTEVKALDGYRVHNLNTELNYTTIQEAIDAPETLNGHTICADAGLYNESVHVIKSLTLIGENPETTVIDPSYAYFALSITVKNADVSGFTIRGADEAGIVIHYMNNIVHNNIIELNHGYSILLYEYDSSHYNVIFNNTITRNGWDGIRLGGNYNVLFDNFIANNCLRGIPGSCGLEVIIGSHNRIENNTVSNEPIGILLEKSSNNTLRNNKMHNNTSNFGVEGSDRSHFLHNIDISNTIDERPIYYLINQSNFVVNQVSCQEAAYIGIVNSNNITIRDMTLTHNFQGLLLAYTNRSLIENVNMSNNSYGITLFSSYGNTLRNCTIAKSGEKWCIEGVGIWLSSSDENTIEKCKVSSSGQCGIVGNSRSNIILANEIFSSNFCGIQLGTGNIVENNIINDNSIGVLPYGTNNTIRGNTLANNYYGIEVHSADNIFYHNNFKNNTFHVWFPFIYTPYNTWDNGKEGNYWDNNASVLDLNSDGINDNPYRIAADNIDRYPLLGMFSSFNTSYGYAVDFVSNSSISDVSFNLSLIEVYPPIATLTFNVSGETGTEGFIRVCIPRILINGSYLIMFDDLIITSTTYPQVRELPCSNETHMYLYINYTHTKHMITITGITMIPEFPSFLILPLFMIATLLAVLIYKKRTTKIERLVQTISTGPQ